ncbi:hypothetical protein MXB_3449 [Myxobolus squamalis]|nr:hypothetical protein MXB_3449 [Myxobolus squamalis]
MICPSGLGKVSILITKQIRQLILENGSFTDCVGPSQPFDMVGWEYAPVPGETFHKLDANKSVKAIKKSFQHRKPQIHERLLGPLNGSGRTVTIGTAKFLQYDEKNPLQINLLIKCDNYGSAEAIIRGIEDCNDKRVSINIFYCGIDHFTTQLLSLLPPINCKYANIMDGLKEAKCFEQIGHAQILKKFELTGKIKRTVLGVKITEGSFFNQPNYVCTICRNAEVIYQATAKMVSFGEECGILLKSTNNAMVGDQIFCYKLIPDERNLRWHY